jgi:hypothetical protein
MSTPACRIVPELAGRRADEALHAAALAVSSAAGDGVFTELANGLASVLGVEAAFIAACDGDDPDQLQVLAMVVDGQPSAGMRCRLEGTPCAAVLKHGFCAYPADLAALFPHDTALADQGAQGYAGAPLCDAGGTPLGSFKRSAMSDAKGSG